MDEETIVFLRALCAKAKEVAILCDAHLEREAKKSKKAPLPQVDEPKATGNRLIPVSKWNDYHDWPKPNSLRWMIFTSHKTGADYFVRRAGRRVLVCEKSFFEWAHMSEEQRVKASPDASRFREKCKI